MLESYARSSIGLLSTALDRTKPCSDLTLWSTFYPVMYHAGATALFGQTFPSNRTIDSFIAFDSAIPLIAGGMPQFLWRQAARARDDLVDTTYQWLAERGARKEDLADTSPFIQSLVSIFMERGWSRREFALTCIQELWVSMSP